MSSKELAEVLSDEVLKSYGGGHYDDDGEIRVTKKVSSGSTTQSVLFVLTGPSCPTTTSCT